MNDQSSEARSAFLPAGATHDRPRIALMGEFSAGKSTLANMMIGTDPLPMQVVATQLPPVWISYGDKATVLVGVDGAETPCDLGAVQTIDSEDVAFIRFQCHEEILKHCDIIDMPGISDPNMCSSVWERIMPIVDAVVWCSPSTQAWRQSEAAVWEGIDDGIRQISMLLLTRADMLLTPRDRAKVLRRVQQETQGLFAKVQTISLLEARMADKDEDLWRSSGAEEFVAGFMEMLEVIGARFGRSDVAQNLGTKPTAGDPGTFQDTILRPRRIAPEGKGDVEVKRASGLEAFTPKFS